MSYFVLTGSNIQTQTQTNERRQRLKPANINSYSCPPKHQPNTNSSDKNY